MIPDIIAVIFLAIPWACLIYIFRGITSDTNPIWGNILAAGIGAVICGMVAIWFFSGTIVSPSIVSNATYQLPTNLTVGEMAAQQGNASGTVNKLGTGGSGMFIRSSISASGGNYTNQTTVNVHTYDIIYQQYQDIGMMFLYLLLCGILTVLFVWFIIDMKRVIEEQDAYDEYIDGG
jgi:hypothetical protein